MEFGKRGIGRLGLELVDCQKVDTYTDLPREIFGRYEFFTQHFSQRPNNFLLQRLSICCFVYGFKWF